MLNFLSSSAIIKRTLLLRLAIAIIVVLATTVTATFILLSPSTAVLVARRLLLLPFAFKFRAAVVAEVASAAWHRHSGIQFRYEVGAPDASQLILNVAPLLWFVPKEELALGKFLAWSFCRENRLKCVWVVASIPCLGADRHRRRGKILHLL